MFQGLKGCGVVGGGVCSLMVVVVVSVCMCLWWVGVCVELWGIVSRDVYVCVCVYCLAAGVGGGMWLDSGFGVACVFRTVRLGNV